VLFASRIRAGSTVIDTASETRQESEYLELVDFLSNKNNLQLAGCLAAKGKSIKESQYKFTVSMYCIPQYRLVAITAGLE